MSPTECLLDTGCSRSMGSQHSVSAFLSAIAEHTTRSATRAPSHRAYGIGGGKTIYSNERVRLPVVLGDRNCEAAFEAGEFGTQPLLLGTNAADKLEIDLKLRKHMAWAYSNRLQCTLPVRRLPGGLVALDLFPTVPVEAEPPTREFSELLCRF